MIRNVGTPASIRKLSGLIFTSPCRSHSVQNYNFHSMLDDGSAGFNNVIDSMSHWQILIKVEYGTKTTRSYSPSSWITMECTPSEFKIPKDPYIGLELRFVAASRYARHPASATCVIVNAFSNVDAFRQLGTNGSFFSSGQLSAINQSRVPKSLQYCGSPLSRGKNCLGTK